MTRAGLHLLTVSAHAVSEDHYLAHSSGPPRGGHWIYLADRLHYLTEPAHQLFRLRQSKSPQLLALEAPAPWSHHLAARPLKSLSGCSWMTELISGKGRVKLCFYNPTLPKTLTWLEHCEDSHHVQPRLATHRKAEMALIYRKW